MKVIDEIDPLEIPTNQKQYPCFICDKWFDQYDLEVHFAITHGTCLEEVSVTNSNNNHSCSVCGLQFTSLELINQHLNSAHQFDTFKCGQCEATYVSYEHLLFHFKESHNKGNDTSGPEIGMGDKPTCLVCGEEFSSLVNLNLHVSTIHSKWKKKRKLCGECLGCKIINNCGNCSACQNDTSHHICKNRRCSKLIATKSVNKLKTGEKSYGNAKNSKWKNRRKRCGECPGCKIVHNCGNCPPCRNDKSHQICKNRRCSKLIATKAVNKLKTGEKSNGKAKTFTTYNCKYCNKTFSHWSKRNNHIRNQHEKSSQNQTAVDSEDHM